MRSYFSAAQEVDRPTFYILFPTRLWSEEIPEFLDSISHTSISLFDSRISIPPSAGQFLPANDLQNLQISIFSNGTEPFHIVILTPPFEAGFFVKAPDIHEYSSNFLQFLPLFTNFFLDHIDSTIQDPRLLNFFLKLFRIIGIKIFPTKL